MPVCFRRACCSCESQTEADHEKHMSGRQEVEQASTSFLNWRRPPICSCRAWCWIVKDRRKQTTKSTSVAHVRGRARQHVIFELIAASATQKTLRRCRNLRIWQSYPGVPQILKVSRPWYSWKYAARIGSEPLNILLQCILLQYSSCIGSKYDLGYRHPTSH